MACEVLQECFEFTAPNAYKEETVIESGVGECQGVALYFP